MLKQASPRLGHGWREYIASLLVLLLCNYADFVSSCFLVLFENYFRKYSFLVMTLPTVMNLRGCNYTTFSARLATKLHLGLIEPRVSIRQTALRHELAVTLLCVLLSNVAASLAVASVYTFSTESSSETLVDIVEVVLVSGIISSAIVVPVVTFILMHVFLKGIRPEVLIGPLESILGDIVTVPTLVIACVLVLELARLSSGLLAVTLFSMVTAFLLLSVRKFDRELPHIWRTRRVVTETVLAALVSTLIEIATGLTLLARFDQLVSRSYVLFAIVPPVLAACGSVCVRFCVQISTLLHLGRIQPRLRPGREVLPVCLLALTQSLVLYLNTGLLGILLSYLTGMPLPPVLALLIVLVGLGSVLIMLCVGYILVVTLFRLGVNPLNVVSPVMMPLCDVITALIYVTTQTL